MHHHSLDEFLGTYSRIQKMMLDGNISGAEYEVETLKSQVQDPDNFQSLLFDKISADILWKKGEVDLAYINIRKVLDGLNTLERNEDEPDKICRILDEVHGSAFNILGLIHYVKGDFKHAHQYHQKALSIREKLGKREFISASINNIGLLHKITGELEEALEYFNRSLSIEREIKNAMGTAIAYHNIADIYGKQGKIDESLEFFNLSLTINTSMGYHQAMAANILEIANLLVESKRENELNRYMQIINKIAEEKENSDNKSIALYNTYVKALFNKSQRNLIATDDAIQQFHKIIDELDLEIGVTLNSLKHLTELYMLELSVFGEMEIMSEINRFIWKMESIGKFQNMPKSYVESLLLKSRLQFLQGEFKKAQEIIASAREVCQEKNLKALADKVEAEEKLQIKDFELLNKLIKENASIGERMEKMRVLEYLKEIGKIKS